MRWCVSSSLYGWIRRHRVALSVTSIILLCFNQGFYNWLSSWSGPSTCIQIISPFTSRNHNAEASESGRVPLLRLHWGQGRSDQRKMFRVYEWVRTGSLWTELTRHGDVCLATQTSIERMHPIGEVCEKWLGPISLSVMIRNEAEFGVLSEFVGYMERCNAIFSQTVSIHLVIPTNNMGRIPDYNFFHDGNLLDLETERRSNAYPCGNPKEFLEMIIQRILPNGIDHSVLYHQNLQRNVARKACGTAWVFMTDVDIIPAPNSSARLTEFYRSPNSKCSKCAFVIPVFELKRSVSYPKTKRELISYANKGLARQFHLKIFQFGHGPTNYSLWMSSRLDEGPVAVSHSVDETRIDRYEPFYVSSDVIPPHDERFLGYGFTRSSQVLEAKMAGWKFKVLTPIFCIHWDLQTMASIRSPPLVLRANLVHMRKSQPGLPSSQHNSLIIPRHLQTSRNYVKYRNFMRELMTKYNVTVVKSKMSTVKPVNKQAAPGARNKETPTR